MRIEPRYLVYFALLVAVWKFQDGGGLPDIFPSDCSALKDGDEWGDLDFKACEACGGMSESDRELISTCYISAVESLHLPDAGTVTVDQVQKVLDECLQGKADFSGLLVNQDLQNRYDVAEIYAEIAEGVSHGTE